MSVYCCRKRTKKFSIANMTSEWGRFKGPPSASEGTFGSAGRSNAVKHESWGREVGAARNMDMKLGQGSMQRKM